MAGKASNQLDLLLRILDERDLGLRQEYIIQAFESPETRKDAEAWVRNHLGPETLLTKEEKTFIDRTGGVNFQGPATSQSSLPVSDEEFEHAISSLQNSTAAIERQCELLETQKKALQDLKARNSLDGERSRHLDERRRKVAREKAQLDFDIEDLTSTLQGRLQSSSKQAEAAAGKLSSNIEKLFNKDDRLLDGLQKILPKLEGQSEDRTSLDEIDRLCHALTVLEGKAIRLRIDATYKDALSKHSAQTNGQRRRSTAQNLESQQTAVRAELEELSSEIDGLLALVAENHYRGPIARSLKTSETDAQAESSKWSEYLALTLHYLTARLEAVDEHYHTVHALLAALEATGGALDEVLESQKTQNESASGLSTQATTSKAAAARGLKPLRLVQANLSEASDPVVQLLRQLDIRVSDTTDMEKLSTTLSSALIDRREKLTALSENTEETLTRHLSEAIGKVEGDVKDLFGAVYANSEYGKVEMVRKNVQEGMKGLEEKTQEVGERMRGLDVEGLGREIRARQREVVEKGPR